MQKWTAFSTVGPEASNRIRGGGVFQFVRTQPNWVLRLAGLAFLIVIGLPILLLVIVAVCAAIIVFGGLALLNVLFGRFSGVLPRRDGRQNVRVIQRVEDVR